MNAVAETVIAEERRRHGRWSVSGAYALVDGRRLPLIDISIGGFLARLPEDGRRSERLSTVRYTGRDVVS